MSRYAMFRDVITGEIDEFDLHDVERSYLEDELGYEFVGWSDHPDEDESDAS